MAVESALLRVPGVGGIDVLNVPQRAVCNWKAMAALFVSIPLCFAYLLLVSILWIRALPAALLLVVIAGQYLMTWMGYLRHELWHNYFPGVNNTFFFRSISYLLFSDPKIYEIAHTTHHRDLHTVGDLEFCCEGYATQRLKRKVQFILELFFGNIAWEAYTMSRLTLKGQISPWRTVWSLSIRILLVVALCFGADLVYPGAGKTMALGYFLSIWLVAVVTRHDQWIEHLGIVSKASMAERVRMVRNLPNIHWTNRLWNFFNHNDPRGHYFHHAYPQLNMRVVSGLKLPEGVPAITISQYLRLLLNYYNSI